VCVCVCVCVFDDSHRFMHVITHKNREWEKESD